MHRPDRKTIRLQGFDYTSKGLYHVTICTKDSVPLFGDIQDAEMVYTDIGLIALEEMEVLGSRYAGVRVVEHVIMPNHVHMLISIDAGAHVSGTGSPNRAPTLGQIVGAYKAGVTRRAGGPIWQSRYYEHIVRGENDLWDTVQYIRNNPLKWQFDKENPDRIMSPAQDDPAP